MSVKVMGKVWDTNLPPNQRLVLLAYADAAEHDGTEIWPGHERLASMTGYSRSQVERITRDLIAVGILIRVEKGYRGRRARFAIPLDHPAFVSQDATQSSPGSVADEADSVATEGNEVAPHATRPVLAVPSSDPVLKIAATPRNRDPIWDMLVELYGAPSPGRESAYGMIVKYLKEEGATPSEMKRRSVLIAATWGQKTATAMSLYNNWSRFDAAIGQVTDDDVGEFVAAERRAASIERLSDE